MAIVIHDATGKLMNADIKHITDLTRRDLKQIADAANSHGGAGIDVSNTTDGLEISIDRGQLTRWVKTIINGGTI